MYVHRSLSTVLRTLSLTESAMYVYAQDQFASYLQRINEPLQYCASPSGSEAALGRLVGENLVDFQVFWLVFLNTS